MAKGTIVGAKKVSIRRSPWITNSEDVVKEVSLGDKVTVDPMSTVYDWKGHLYYNYLEFGRRAGWIRASCVQLQQRRNSHGGSSSPNDGLDLGNSQTNG